MGRGSSLTLECDKARPSYLFADWWGGLLEGGGAAEGGGREGVWGQGTGLKDGPTVCRLYELTPHSDCSGPSFFGLSAAEFYGVTLKVSAQLYQGRGLQPWRPSTVAGGWPAQERKPQPTWCLETLSQAFCTSLRGASWLSEAPLGRGVP